MGWMQLLKILSTFGCRTRESAREREERGERERDRKRQRN